MSDKPPDKVALYWNDYYQAWTETPHSPDDVDVTFYSADAVAELEAERERLRCEAMDWRAVAEQQEPVAWSRLYRRVSDERDAAHDAIRRVVARVYRMIRQIEVGKSHDADLKVVRDVARDAIDEAAKMLPKQGGE